MPLLINTPQIEENQKEFANHSIEKEELKKLTLVTKSVIQHQSPMTDMQKEEVRQHAPQLKSLLEQTLAEKHDLNEVDLQWNGEEVELKGVSKMALHNFILKAEKLGKNITYAKTYTVSIVD